MGGSASESTPGVGQWSHSAGLLDWSGVPTTLTPSETPVVSPRGVDTSRVPTAENPVPKSNMAYSSVVFY